MSGLDEILNIIDAQQKETEKNIMVAADKKVREINEDAKVKAEKAYSDYMQRARVKNEHGFETACSGVDAAFKRQLLEYKVKCIDKAVEKTIEKLRKLPEKEYFELLAKLIIRELRKGEGVVALNSRDLKRLPAEFRSRIEAEAAKAGGSISISSEPADISDGFILSYGNISENCSFSAIIESERDAVRDTAAKALFGQVSR